MKARINDYVEFEYNNKLINGSIVNIEDDSISVKSLIDGMIIHNLKEDAFKRIISNTVLCYIEKDDSYLMLLRNKRKDDMNKGKWIGVGGHIEPNESKEDALIREIKEETNLNLLDYKLRSIIYFHNDNYMEVMNLYTSDKFEGELSNCDEGTLKWVKKSDILDLNLWEGDKSFLPLLIQNEPYFEMELFYENDKLIKVNRF